jgi:thiol-disulfide isomerase/thioredoxin
LIGFGRLAGYGQSASKPKGAPSQTAPAAATAPGAKVPVLDQEGLRKTIARDPAAKHPLLLNFWATWCEPCRDEFPDLIKLANEFGPKGLDFAAVSFDFDENSQAEIQKFVAQVKAEHLPVFWLNVSDPEPSIKMVDAEWGGVIPITFLFDGDGKLVFKHSGRFDPKELREAVENQMKGK